MKYAVLLAIGFVLSACATTGSYRAEEPAQVASENRNPASTSFPDYISENSGQTTLTNCGQGGAGSAKLRRIGGTLYIEVSNMSCASYASSRDGYLVHKLDKELDGGHGGLIEVDESITGWRTVILGSANFIKKYAVDPQSVGNTKGDIIKFYIQPQKVLLDLTWGSSDTYPHVLARCGGTVKAQINSDRSLSVVFKGVRYCQQFALRSVNGGTVGKVYTLQDQGFDHGGSFTISPKDIDWGKNEIEMSVYSTFVAEDLIHLRVNGSPF